MSRCSCGGVDISCPNGCGCFCAGEGDCTRWCEPVEVEAAFDIRTIREGGVVRTFTASDGTQRLVLNATATTPNDELPVHKPGTRLQGCMQGASLETIALVLGALHGKSVSVAADRAKQTIDERVSGTLEEIASRFGLTVA